MARRTFLYYLFSENQLPLYITEQGFVFEGDGDYRKSDGQPAILKYSPLSWSDTLVKYARNIKYWGIVRDMTVPMKFPKDGFAILRERIHDHEGIETKCDLGIMKLDRSVLPYQYKPWYLSEINFAKYKEGETGATVEALEGGASKYVKAFENLQVEIPIDEDPEHINVLFDGMDLFCVFNFNTLADLINKDNVHLLPCIFLNGEGTNFNITHSDILTGEEVSAGYQATHEGSIIQAIEDTEVTFEGVVRILFAAVGSNYVLGLRTNNNDYVQLLNEVTSSPAHNYAFNGTITLQKGERLFLEAGYFGEGSILYGSTSFKITFKNKFKPTYVKGLYLSRAIKVLMEKISDNKCTLSSNWLASKKDIVLVSGDSLRGIPNAKLKFSLSDFFRSVNHFSAAMGTSVDKLVIERRQDVFKSDIIMSLGEVDNAELVVAEDLFFNTIKAGGPNVDYEDVNGRSEFAQGQIWKTPITKVTADLDLSTPFRRDPYGAEYARINLEGKTTTDSDGDNDVWMINIEEMQRVDATTDPDTVYYKLYRPPYVITGVPDPVGVYNVLLSPKWSIINNWQHIHSVLDKLDSRDIELTYAEKNKELRTVGVLDVKESLPIGIGTMGDKLFLPWYFTFTTKININLLSIIDATPYGKIEFVWKGRTWRGYLMDGGVKPGTHDKANWKLLVAPENNLKLFNA